MIDFCTGAAVMVALIFLAWVCVRARRDIVSYPPKKRRKKKVYLREGSFKRGGLRPKSDVPKPDWRPENLREAKK